MKTIIRNLTIICIGAALSGTTLAKSPQKLTLAFKAQIDRVIVPAGMQPPTGLVSDRLVDGFFDVDTKVAKGLPGGLNDGHSWYGTPAKLQIGSPLDVSFVSGALTVSLAQIGWTSNPRYCLDFAKKVPCARSGQMKLTPATADGASKVFQAYTFSLIQPGSFQIEKTLPLDETIQALLAASEKQPAKMLLGFAPDANRTDLEFRQLMSPLADWVKVVLTIKEMSVRSD